MNELQNKTVSELKDELIALRKEQFSLRMQHKSGQLRDTSMIRKVRRNIARVKTFINQKEVAA